MVDKQEGGSSPAHKLLQEYRCTLWRKMALEDVFGSGSKALNDCKQRIAFTQELVDALRNNRRAGNRLYWVIFATYMTTTKPSDIDAVLSNIEAKYETIPRRTYFWLKKRAISILDKHLEEQAKNSLASCA